MAGVRIIGGAWGGRRLAAPPGLETRPLTDRIKQSMFDWLGQRLDGWRVVDACAGSGAFGIECASRGASEVHLCEPGRHALPTLRANLATLGDPPALRIHGTGHQRVLPALTGLHLVFCDPPFPWFREQPDDLLRLLELSAAAIAPDGAVLLRGERGDEPPPVAALRETERRTYGRSWVARLRRCAPET
jgi:16S rRNA (guanine966-N2)-methyltransferase